MEKSISEFSLNQTTDQIFEEIRQLKEQYGDEVDSNRRAWPNSIRDRIFELKRLGVSFQKISETSGIPYSSILSWKKREREKLSKSPAREIPTTKFRELTVRGDASQKPTTVTVAGFVNKRGRGRPPGKASKPGAVIVTTPSGYRVEAFDGAEIVKILKALPGSSCF